MTVSDLQRDFTTALQHQLAKNWIEAERHYRALIRSAPDEPVLHYNLGLVLKAQSKFGESIGTFRAALRLKSNFPEAVNNLATTLTVVGELDEAIDLLEACTSANPLFAEAFNNLGDAYKDRGEIDRAVLALRRATELQPTNPVFRSNLIYALHYHPHSTGSSLREEAETWDRHFGQRTAVRALSSQEISSGHRRRIGYIGAFFRTHCQSLFLAPLLAHHDRTKHEIFCYADDTRADEATSQLRGYVDHWHNIAGQETTAITTRIRADELDLLIDLGSHTAENYLPVFVQRPAPIQVSWLGYPGTTGLAAVDARLTDPYLDPIGQHDDAYTEKSIRLPCTFWCYDPLALTKSIPIGHRKYDGPITFGCLNNFCKVNDQVLALWSRVLAAIPNSRFVIMAPHGQARLHILTALRVDSLRITFVEFAPRETYLERYHSIDICLDTYPYNGHTTSLDALWMGVPVVTLCGETAVSRAGYSFLANLGLAQLAAFTTDDFVRIASELAQDRQSLSELHQTLRARIENSPLMNAEQFARDFENALFSTL